MLPDHAHNEKRPARTGSPLLNFSEIPGQAWTTRAGVRATHLAQSSSTFVLTMLAHRVRLDLTPAQEEYFRRACGVARFAYNWALEEWQRQYRAGEKPSEAALRKRLNAIKDAQFPWMREVTKTAPQQAIKNLGRAYSNFFGDLAKYRQEQLPWKRVRIACGADGSGGEGYLAVKPAA